MTELHTDLRGQAAEEDIITQIFGGKADGHINMKNSTGTYSPMHMPPEAHIIETYDDDEWTELPDDAPLWMQVVAWIESCDVTEGPDMGKPFILEPFQIEFIKHFCLNSLNLLSLPRGMGKSTLLGAITAAHVMGPLAIPGTTIPVVAVDKAQAAIIVNHCIGFLKKDIDFEPERFKINANKDETVLIDRHQNITVKAVSSNYRAAHGKAPNLFVADEPAQWSPNLGEKVFNAMVTGAGKQKNSKVVVIGTMPDRADHFFAKAMKLGLDPKKREGTGTYAMLFQAPPGSNYDDISAVKTATPMWNRMPHMRKKILEEIKAIKEGTGSKASFMAYRLNMGTPETEEIEYVLGRYTREQWESVECQWIDLPPREGELFLGFDLGQSESLTAAAAYWPMTGRLEIYAALPAAPSLAERGENDGVPQLYDKAYERGELITFPGFVTPVKHFFNFIQNKLKDEHGNYLIPEKIVSDSFKEVEFRQAVAESAVGWEQLLEFRRVGRGSDGAGDLTNFQKEVYENILKAPVNLLMRSAVREAEVKRDTNQNGAIDKSRHRGRIDVLQAVIHAVGTGRRFRQPDIITGRTDDLSDWVI